MAWTAPVGSSLSFLLPYCSASCLIGITGASSFCPLGRQAQNDDASVIPMRHDSEQYGSKNDGEPLTGVLERTYSLGVGWFSL